MPKVDGVVAHGLPGEVVRDRVQLKAVAIENGPALGEVGVVFDDALHVEVLARGGDLEAGVAPAGGELGNLFEGQVGPLAGEQGDGMRAHRCSSVRV